MKKSLLLVPFFVLGANVYAADGDEAEGMLYDEGSVTTQEAQDTTTTADETMPQGSTNEPTVTDEVGGMNDSANTKVKKTTPASAQTATTAQNATREKVMQIQEALNRNGATLKVDGLMGRGTEQAIRDFQQKNALSVTGQVDEPTMSKLGVMN